MLSAFSVNLEEHRDDILAYYDLPLSSGPREGTNNKIGILQIHTYGFRDLDFSKLKISALHASKYA